MSHWTIHQRLRLSSNGKPSKKWDGQHRRQQQHRQHRQQVCSLPSFIRAFRTARRRSCSCHLLPVRLPEVVVLSQVLELSQPRLAVASTTKPDTQQYRMVQFTNLWTAMVPHVGLVSLSRDHTEGALVPSPAKTYATGQICAARTRHTATMGRHQSHQGRGKPAILLCPMLAVAPPDRAPSC